MALIKAFLHYNRITNLASLINNDILNSLLLKTFFLNRYYKLNDQVWQDGFLIDFLQKKFLDKWVRRFLITSSYLFNERVVFDRLVRAYTDLVIWSGSRLFIYEFSNVASTLLVINLLIVFVFLLLSMNYWFIVYIL